MSPTLVSTLLVLFQSSSQTWAFQNNTDRHSCTLEHKWDFKQHRQEGLSRAWSWMFLGGRVRAPSGWTLMCDCTGAEITRRDHGIFTVSFAHRDGLEQERGWLKSRPSPSRVVLASRSDSEKEIFAKLKGQTSGPLCQPTSSFAERALLRMLKLRSCCIKKRGGQLPLWMTKWPVHNFLSKESLSSCGY